MTKKVLAIIAEGFEEVEAITPIDLLRRAGIKVTVASVNDDVLVTGSHGIKIIADIKLADVKDNFDALVFHGGSPGAENLAVSSNVKAWINEYNKSGKIVSAICASPALVLAPTGVLNGKKACTYPGLEKNFSPSTLVSYDPVVKDGNIITSRGLGTAHAFGLELIEALLGKEQRDKIASATLFDHDA